MRITDKMMSNNMLLYINQNKKTISTLEQQMATGKKIQKPSENPIVAIRAINFRSDINDINQYKTNIRDAVSWMGITEQALSNMHDILDKARELSVQGSTGTMDTNERKDIAVELEQLMDQLVQEGNVSYAGRYVFSGYKTDTPLTFGKDNNKTYEITESFSIDDIETIQRVEETPSVAVNDVYRIRLAYNDVVNNANTASDINGLTVSTFNSSDSNVYYPTQGTVNFLQDTGELIIHEDDINSVQNTGFNFIYEKSSFEANDLKPEHFLNCTYKEDPTDNTTWVDYQPPDDQIKYQIGYNQDLEINTLGKDIFSTDLVREFRELIVASNNIPELGENATQQEKDLQALKKSELGKMFQQMIGKIDGYLQANSTATSDIGSRINRLELTENRLDNDKINITELMSDNEDVDMAEAVVQFNTASVIYNASLMSSGKMLQSSLLDFIR